MVELSTPIKYWKFQGIAIEGLQVQFLSVSFLFFAMLAAAIITVYDNSAQFLTETMCVRTPRVKASDQLFAWLGFGVTSIIGQGTRNSL